MITARRDRSFKEVVATLFIVSVGILQVHESCMNYILSTDSEMKRARIDVVADMVLWSGLYRKQRARLCVGEMSYGVLDMLCLKLVASSSSVAYCYCAIVVRATCDVSVKIPLA